MTISPFCLFSKHMYAHKDVGDMVLPMVSNYAYDNDLQMAVMQQETQQCAKKGWKEEDVQQVNMDINNAIKKKELPVHWFKRKETYSIHFLEVKDTEQCV